MEEQRTEVNEFNYLEVASCKSFFREDWLLMISHRDGVLRSYAFMNESCPVEILQMAVTESGADEAGILGSAAANTQAPSEVVAFALNSPYWPARGAALTRPDVDWVVLFQNKHSLTMFEKLILFGKRDCPEWMLRTIWKLPPQMGLDGKDINDSLRSSAERRLKKAHLLTADDLAEIEAKAASK